MKPAFVSSPAIVKTAAAALLAGLATISCDRQSTRQPPPPEVATVTVAPQPLRLTTELPGRTSPFRVAEIRPQVNGLVQKRLFEEGAEVGAGQALYQIDPAPFQALLDNAEAALARAEANLPTLRLRAERFRSALADKAVSQQDFDDASAAFAQGEAEVRAGRASVETARINLEYARVISPISGRIGRSSVTDGAIVTAYQPVALATIQQLDPIYVDVPQSTAELLRLRRSLENGRLRHDAADQSRVRLILEDGQPYPLDGSLQFQEVAVDQSTGTVILRILFPNPDRLLLPGMFVRAVVQEGVDERAILIPQQAVARTPKGEPEALVVGPDGKVAVRMLALDRAIGDRWVVASGLAPGDRVIAEGMQAVRPGMTVRTVPFAAAAAKN